jgi:hypothetical protein
MKTPVKTKKTAKKMVAKHPRGAKAEDRRKEKVNANRTLTLTITAKHIKEATCKDASKCVIALAIGDSEVGQFAEGFAVGSNCTKIIIGDKVLRYKTPYKLAAALKHFDITGKWDLPEGTYTLLPYVGATRRWESARRLGGKQDVFRGRIAAPTRYVPRIGALCKVL